MTVSCPILVYCKVLNTSTYRLVAPPRIYWLCIMGKFNTYLLWPFRKKSIFTIVIEEVNCGFPVLQPKTQIQFLKNADFCKYCAARNSIIVAIFKLSGSSSVVHSCCAFRLPGFQAWWCSPDNRIGGISK